MRYTDDFELNHFETTYAGPTVIVVPANPPFVADNAGLYAIVARAIAASDDHLGELVQLFVALNAAGVRLDEHLDCLVEALALEVDDDDNV